MATYQEALEHMQKGGIAFNGFKYRIEEGQLQRSNGWWQPLQWPITDEEKASNDWQLLRTKAPTGADKTEG